MRTSRLAALTFGLLMLGLESGCSGGIGPRSPYEAHYEARLQGVAVPPFNDIRLQAEVDLRGPLILDEPLVQVWEACLDLALQSRGILAIAHDPDGSHRLLMVVGRVYPYGRRGEKVLDRWLALGVRARTPHSTEVYVAFVDARSARVASTLQDRLPSGVRDDPQRSPAGREAGELIARLQTTFKRDEYLRLLEDPALHPVARGPLPGSWSLDRLDHEDLLRQVGDFNSATLRRYQIVLDWPEIQERILGIIRNLEAATQHREPPVRVFLLADTRIGLQIEANGDLFLRTGTLDALLSDTEDREGSTPVDQFAGLLAHELAHLHLRHLVGRGKAKARVGISRTTLAVSLVAGGALLAGLYEGPDSASPDDTLLTTEEALIGGAVGAAALLLPGQVGESLGTEIGNQHLQRYSRRQELQADEYATELLWAAGYNYKGLLNFLREHGTTPWSFSESQR